MVDPMIPQRKGQVQAWVNLVDVGGSSMMALSSTENFFQPEISSLFASSPLALKGQLNNGKHFESPSTDSHSLCLA
jgi:hypothetical protein